MRNPFVSAFFGRMVARFPVSGLDHDPRQLQRHGTFVGLHFFIAALGLAGIPLVFALARISDTIGTTPAIVLCAIVGLYAVPGFIVAMKSRLDFGLYASAAVTAVLVAAGGIFTGGTTSPVWALMVLAPLTVALTRNPAAVRLAAVGAGGLAIVGATAGGLSHDLSFFTSLPLVAGIAGTVATALLSNLGDKMTRADIADMRVRLAESEEIAGLASDVVSFHDRRGDIYRASGASEAIIGAAAASLLGNGLYERVHPGDRPLYLLALADAVNGRARSSELRLSCGGESGEIRTVKADFLPGSLADPECHAAVVLRLNDISRSKSLEARLRRLEERQAQAPEMIGKFLRRLAHDFRSPLNAVIGFSEILLQEIFGKLETGRQRDYVQLIHESGETLLEMIDQSADYARLESQNYTLDEERIPTGSILLAAIEQVSPRAARFGIEILPEISVHVPEIVTDRRAFRHMAEALIWHGAKRLPSGSRLRFVAGVEDGELWLAVADTAGNPTIIGGEDEPTLALELAERFAARLGGRFSREGGLQSAPRLVIRLPLGRPAAALDAVAGVAVPTRRAS